MIFVNGGKFIIILSDGLQIVGILMDNGGDKRPNVNVCPIKDNDGVFLKIKFTHRCKGQFFNFYGEGFSSAIVNPKIFLTP